MYVGKKESKYNYNVYNKFTLLICTCAYNMIHKLDDTNTAGYIIMYVGTHKRNKTI